MKSYEAKHYLLNARIAWAEVPDRNVYPFNLAAITKIEDIKFHPAKTFFVGENGSGKSTLAEALAVAWGLNAEGGSKNFNFKKRHSHLRLSAYLRISKGLKHPKDGLFLRAESDFNMATNIEELDTEPGGGPPVI